MPIHTGRGVFVAIEGIDGAGKTTQVGLLAEALRQAGETVITSKEPTDGPWGSKIRQSASDGRMPLAKELEAFLNDRAEHVEQVIMPALTLGEIVVLDRYYYSTIAYQGARGANVAKLRSEMEDRFPVPDAVFLLDIDPTLSLYRISETRQEAPNVFERIPDLREARRVFNSLEDSHLSHIDGSRSIECVHHEILQLFIEIPLKVRRCAKDYGCDDPFHCTPRFTSNCEWWNLSRSIRPASRLLPV